MGRISVMAVLTGGIVDVGGTAMLALPVVVYAMIAGNIMDLPQPDQAAALMAFLKGHVVLYLVLATLGTLCSLLGGYVAAVLARRAEVLNGALSSYLCVVLGVSSLAAGTQQMPALLFVLLLPLGPLVAGLGGYLRLIQVRARARREGTGQPLSAA